MPLHIDGYGFGRIQIDGTSFTKDVIILGDRVISPWWRTAGGHVFAVQDMQEVLAARPGVVVLGTGYYGLVAVCQEVLDALAEAGSVWVRERTPRAVERFNELCGGGRDVAAALHLTC